MTSAAVSPSNEAPPSPSPLQGPDCVLIDDDDDVNELHDVIGVEHVRQVRAAADGVLDRLERHDILLCDYGNCAGRDSLVSPDEYRRRRRDGTLFNWRTVAHLVLTPALVALQRRQQQRARAGPVRRRQRGIANADNAPYAPVYGPMSSRLLRSIVCERDPRVRYVANGEIIMARLMSRMPTRFQRFPDGRLSIDAQCYARK